MSFKKEEEKERKCSEMKKRISSLLLLAALLVGLTACGGASGGAMPGDAGNGATAEAPMEDSAAAEAESISASTGSGTSTSYDPDSVKLIYRADLYVQTLDFDAALTRLTQMVEEAGGYFESTSLYQGGYYSDGLRSGSYTIRVPSEGYAAFLQGVGETENCKVVRQEETVKDIGMSYADTEARLETLRIQQERLQTLLSQAEVMTDIIELENALASVEYEIEQYGSTLKRYDSLVNYSTIQLELEERERLSDTPAASERLGARMSRGFRSAVTGFVDGLGDLAVWFSYHFIGLIIFAAIVAAAVVLVRRSLRKRAGLPPRKPKLRKLAKDTKPPEDGNDPS